MNFDNTSFNQEASMNRTDWEFEYTAIMLARAAEAKKAYRQERADWWDAEQKKLMAEVRESGLEINESVASQYATSATRGPQLSVRHDLQQKLAECHTKIREHLSAVREYDGWAQVLNANPEARLKLKHSDWLFFFAEN